jgi:hypothetical protein
MEFGKTLSSLYLSRDLLEQPDAICETISRATGFTVTWDKSSVVPGEWLLTPAGPSFNFGREGKYGRPNLSFYGYGTREHEAYRVTLKLNLNGTPDHEEGRELLIRSANSLLEIDGQSLSDDFVRRIRSTNSVLDIAEKQPDAELLHIEIGSDYRTELQYEAGRYTSLILHLIQHAPAENHGPERTGDPSASSASVPTELVRNFSNERSMAIILAQKHVKKQLKSPGTAAFPGMFDEGPQVRSIGSHKYRVRSWVDAQNELGALLRKNYECVVETDGNDGWRVVSFEMDD